MRYTLNPDNTMAFKSINKEPENVDIDLSKYFPPVVNQGDFGSCTAASGSSLLYALHNKAGKNPPVFAISPLYFWEREEENETTIDAGARLSNTASVVSKIGDCPSTMSSYDKTSIFTKPTDAMLKAAKPWRIKKATRYVDFNSIMNVLETETPLQLGIAIYSSFESQAVANSGQVQMPDMAHEEFLGYHAVDIVGKKHTTNTFKCLTSWGEGWGDKGYFYLPFEYLKTRGLFISAWSWEV